MQDDFLSEEANVKTVRGVKTITTLKGYKDLMIYLPSVLLEGLAPPALIYIGSFVNGFLRSGIIAVMMALPVILSLI